ncbi:sensor histidine kinase [Bacillus sp. 1P06AnD]|uniref:sensor histidine kinase n=1 Tax=Bacillus sp. 1P06AnD TaxID=3132208 RepID=UPI0039A37938
MKKLAKNTLSHIEEWATVLKQINRKLSHKLFLQISLVLVLVYFISILVNTYFLPKYFLYEKKQALSVIVNHLQHTPASKLKDEIKSIQDTHQVTIVYGKSTNNEEELNWLLKEQFSQKGVALSTFWITQDSIDRLHEGQIVNKLYHQKKLKSSVLISFIQKNELILAVAEPISYSTETLAIVNQFFTYISLAAFFVMIVLAMLFTRKIVKPIKKIQNHAENISTLTFGHVDIQTNDELEELSASINKMSDKLQQAHNELETKNENLRLFIGNITHELKTPLALIKAYSSGIRDGLDDGTYLQEIDQQSDYMSELISRLLLLSKIQMDKSQIEEIDLLKLIRGIIAFYDIKLKQHGLHVNIHTNGLQTALIQADKKKMEMAIANLLSNSIKYSNTANIEISISQSNHSLQFSISNGWIPLKGQRIEQLWEPFFVGEESRSKELSGTGLGLSIVRAILEQHHAHYAIRMPAEQRIEISFILPLKQPV